MNRDNGIDSLDVFSYEEYVGIGEEGADELGYMTISENLQIKDHIH